MVKTLSHSEQQCALQEVWFFGSFLLCFFKQVVSPFAAMI